MSCPVPGSHRLQGQIPRVRLVICTPSLLFIHFLRPSLLVRRQKQNVVPCSDAAGEIMAVGGDVRGWEIGDRVSPNFAIDHIYGDVTEDIKNTGLGGQIDGVLREYINVPAHVRSWSCSSLIPSSMLHSPSSEFPTI